MTKKYSIAEARKALPRLLHEVEDGQHVEITRRGRPVAMVIPLDEYLRLASDPDGFMKAYSSWRQTVEPEDLALPRDFFDELRDQTPGREVEI
ncbi:MAG: type II toxin-antitoxin system prevent-host-death family antitoxin [Deltaproteobacteria bacterium]|nr:type II toxin-antitoxin system prevent-host-death family antitoxin [Deltaproteobacteria bacterium]